MKRKIKVFILPIFVLLFTIFTLAGRSVINAFAAQNQGAKTNIIATDVEIATDSIIVTLTLDETRKFKSYSAEDFSDIGCISIEDLTQSTSEYVQSKINNKLVNRSMLVEYTNYKRILKLEISETSEENIYNMVKKLNERSDIYIASPNYVYNICETPNDVHFGHNDLWGLNGVNGIQAEETWNITTGRNTVVVGVMDTGIQGNHPDLVAQINDDDLHRDCTSNPITVVKSEDLVDPHGHGTHVAGTIGAQGNNSIGVSGVCWNIEFVSLRVFDEAGVGSTDDIIRAINYATSQSIPILNYSGGGINDNPNVKSAIENYNGLLVCAAGNGGSDGVGDDNDVVHHYPSDYSYNQSYSDRVISVGAININANRSGFSNYGENTVSIYAPGSYILSTYPQTFCTGETVLTNYGYHLKCESIFTNQYTDDGSWEWRWKGAVHHADAYHYMDGTSMATPHVTGVAALMLSVNPNLTAVELKSAILSNSDTITITIPDGNSGTTTQSVKKLNAFQAVSSVAFETNGAGNCITDLNFEPNGELTIPSVIDGVTITGIGEELFSGCANLASITLPSSVTSIGANAFAGCTSLTSITIPSSVAIIGGGAFKDCSSLTNVSISTGVMDIGVGVFSGCEHLSTLTVASGNTAYSTINNVLFNKAGTELIYYPEGKSGTTYTVPSSIQKIAPFAFADNRTLTKVTLSGDLINIGEGAFDGCNALDKVYICKTNDFVYVSDNSFDGNAETRKIYVPYPLNEAYLANELWQQYAEDIVVPETEIVFASNGGSACGNRVVLYKDYLSLPKPTREGYTLTGWYANSACTGDAYNKQTRWDSLEETVTFYAGWSPKIYSITYIINFTENGMALDSYADSYTIEQSIIYDIPERTGYTFAGWYEDYALTQAAGDGFDIGNTENQVLYAKWNANSYIVTYDLNDSVQFPASINGTTGTVVFGDSNYQFAVPTRTGFTFNGWKVSKNGLYEFYTNGSGIASQEWDITNNVTIVADWTRHSYCIRINAEETFAWLGEDGLTSTQTSIEYGSIFDNVPDLEEEFNPNNVTVKEGYKFEYYKLSNGARFTDWSQIAALYENGSTVDLTAHFVRETNFNIRYLNDEFEAITADFGDVITLAQQADSIGHTFSHWVVASESEANGNARFVETSLDPGTVFNYSIMPDLSVGVEEDAVTIWLKAVQIPNQYQVTLQTAFGTISSNIEMVTYGSGFELPVPSEVEGREFIGWILDDKLARITPPPLTNANGQSMAVWQYAEDVTLDAAWRTIAYSVTYDLDGGGYEEEVTNPDWYMVDKTVILNNPIKEGYRFMGWQDDETGEILTLTTIPAGSTGDKSYTAQWAHEYTLTFTANNLFTGSMTINGVYATIKAIYGEEVKLPDVNFGGFILRDDSNYYDQGASYTVTGDKTFELVEKNGEQLYDNSVGYYEIWTYNQLNNVVRTNSSCNHRMMANITQPEDTNWIPIENFSGVFDGNNYNIYNLFISHGWSTSAETISSENFGLFEENTGTIKNLSMSVAIIELSTYAATYETVPVYCGFIAAKNFGTIAYCDVIGSFSKYAYITSKIEVRAGAICGYNTGTVEYCNIVETDIQITTGYGGGIAGYNKGGTIRYCEVELSRVTCYQQFQSDTADGYTSNHYAAIGGIVGCAEGGIISNCEIWSDVQIKYTGYTSNSLSLAPEIGNLIGLAKGTVTMTANTTNNNTDSGELQNVTYNCGEDYWWWDCCYNGASHTHNQTQYVGGDVGRYV